MDVKCRAWKLHECEDNLDNCTWGKSFSFSSDSSTESESSGTVWNTLVFDAFVIYLFIPEKNCLVSWASRPVVVHSEDNNTELLSTLSKGAEVNIFFPHSTRNKLQVAHFPAHKLLLLREFHYVDWKDVSQLFHFMRLRLTQYQYCVVFSSYYFLQIVSFLRTQVLRTEICNFLCVMKRERVKSEARTARLTL